MTIMPAELAEIIATHRALFGGWTMMSDEQSDPQGEQDADKPADKGDDFKSEHSKSAVLQDLAAERDKRQELEQQVAKLAPLQKLADLLGGGEQKGGEFNAESAVADLNQRLDDAAHDALVARTARKHDLSDEDEELIKNVRDPKLMESLAQRLQRDAGANQSGETRRTPKPDRSAGRGGDEKSTGSVASGRDRYRERHPQKN